MQLHLETAELNLVANILLGRPSPAAGIDEGLLNKILAKDLCLDSDELERLGTILGERERELKMALAQRSPVSPSELEKLGLLERALERVNEACVMF